MLEILVAALVGRHVPVREALENCIERVSSGTRWYRQERNREETIGRSLLAKLELAAVTSVDITNNRDMQLNVVSRNTNKPVSAATVQFTGAYYATQSGR
ncbi:hypothetical protein JAO10_31205 [Burkholderia contaminans]|uniref:hypothetical protein n=1 Tax=Burkholderia cepacia complex TaxID=87882 RepID=UPI0010415CFA|nr:MULTISPECIES: hypothetical protein [Burkholderia cepacia complex]MBH9724802.1 hypothetical protein [Burkholderia contaminans]MBR8094161.1 hypothetical protein [Burkholderia cenocepacia]MBY4710645.1 hypothetical protein [Burkholderia cepacia]MBY4737173.1 hypothetical protein [Burkholderia cepacia]MBY4744511.1 hypothetical protein [Burkholderia cepacia]